MLISLVPLSTQECNSFNCKNCLHNECRNLCPLNSPARSAPAPPTDIALLIWRKTPAQLVCRMMNNCPSYGSPGPCFNIPSDTFYARNSKESGKKLASLPNPDKGLQRFTFVKHVHHIHKYTGVGLPFLLTP